MIRADLSISPRCTYEPRKLSFQVLFRRRPQIQTKMNGDGKELMQKEKQVVKTKSWNPPFCRRSASCRGGWVCSTKGRGFSWAWMGVKKLPWVSGVPEVGKRVSEAWQGKGQRQGQVQDQWSRHARTIHVIHWQRLTSLTSQLKPHSSWAYWEPLS